MADPSAHPDANADAGLDRVSTTSTPRWVYVFGLIAVVLILLVVILHLTGGGLAGHLPS